MLFPPATNQYYILTHVGSSLKELVELENSYHVATLDNDQTIIVEKLMSLLNKIGNTN